MDISEIPTDEAITEMVSGLPAWDPPKFDLQITREAPEEAPVQWHEPVREEVTVPLSSITTDLMMGASFELPA